MTSRLELCPASTVTPRVANDRTSVEKEGRLIGPRTGQSFGRFCDRISMEESRPAYDHLVRSGLTVREPFTLANDLVLIPGKESSVFLIWNCRGLLVY